MSKRLRIVSASDSGEVLEGSFVDAARAALEQVLSDGATVLVIIAELPNRVLGVQAVPDCHAVVQGLHAQLTEKIYPEETE